MEIVPVIDLMAGRAVHARRGERETYRPVRSALCPSSDPLEVAKRFLGLHPFAKLYLADLDAIRGRGDNRATLERLRAALPETRIWVDSGLAEADACRAWLALGLGDAVLGSESQTDVALLDALNDEATAGRIVLSLDFSVERFLGPAALLAESRWWPQDVIVITLARVGAGLGPDCERLAQVRAKAGARRIFAGGGIRDLDDLLRLKGIGLAGALVATALHDKRIGPEDIRRATGTQPR